jgi:hypothetical protein
MNKHKNNMKATELLEKYPLSTEVVRTWFMEKMIESVREADEVPEDFKNFMLEQGIDNNKMAIMIDANPRMLFDVFDENDLFIEIFMYPDVTFTCKIGNEATTNSWKTRKDAEAFAIEAAFEMLENKLKPVSEDEHFDTASGDNGND